MIITARAGSILVITSLGGRQHHQCHDHKEASTTNVLIHEEEGEENGMDREPDAAGDSGAEG